MRFLALFGFFGWRSRSGDLSAAADQDGGGDDLNRSRPTRGLHRANRRWPHSRDAATSSRPRGGFPTTLLEHRNQRDVAKVPSGYSAALTRPSPGGLAFFQSPGARTLLADRISMPMMWPSASTS